jgi:hypothetical protein
MPLVDWSNTALSAFANYSFWQKLSIALSIDDYRAQLAGAVGPAEKAALIENEAAGIVQASGGQLPVSSAADIASGDVTAALVSFNADPSQVGISLDSFTTQFSGVLKYVIVALAIYLAIVIVRLFR